MVDITKLAVQDRIKKAYKESPKDPNETAKRVCVENNVTDPIPVEIVDDGFGGSPVNVFDEITNVATASTQTIASYTVPAGQTFYLKHVEASGSNRGEFTVKINGNVEARKRTYQPIFNVDFPFYNFQVGEGVTVLIEVENNRSATNEFDARILGNLI